MTVEVKVGLLLSRSALDDDLRNAALLAAKNHVASQIGTMNIRIHEAYTGDTPSGTIQAFTALWSEGVRVFIVGGDGQEMEALCHYMKNSRKEALLVSPTAHISTSKCSSYVSLSPPHGALIAVEVARLASTGITTIIPVITRSHMDQVMYVELEAEKHGITVAPPVLLHSHNTSTVRLKKALAASPAASVWISVGADLPEFMVSLGLVLDGRLVMLHAHPTHHAQLLNHPTAKAAAEICAVCTVAWAGSSQIHSTSRRHILSVLTPQNPLVATLAYDAATLVLLAITYTNSSDVYELKANLLAQAVHTGVTKAEDSLSDKISGWAVRMRLVAKHLVGRVVLQESQWLLEGTSKVVGYEGQQWVVVHENHSPTHLITQEEVQSLTQHISCSSPVLIQVTAHDPLTDQPVTTVFQSTAAPHVLLVPNGSALGFSVQAWCQSRQGTPGLELGCQGATSHSDTLRCVSTKSNDGSSSRRIIRSLVTRHGFPIRRQRQGGPMSQAMRKLVGFLKHEDFKSMIPQIGGCVGATGGCSFCFIYILWNNVAVNPGVCYGACSVAVGGSCTTLMAKGIQYQLDHTVICTELFTQGRLSLSSYLADASFGTRLATTNAQALRGYQMLAAPLVAIMKVSPTVSDLVEVVAKPWVRHMEFQEGIQDNDDMLGCLITILGLPLCTLVAVLTDHVGIIAMVLLTASLCHQVRKL